MNGESEVRGNAPTIGAAVLLPNSLRGWQPGPILLPSPIVLLRFRDGVARLFTPESATPFHESRCCPLTLLQEVLQRICDQVPLAGPRAGKPSFPLAIVAASYEFGRNFSPHEHAFPYAAGLKDDELFAAVHMDAYRPDPAGDTERFGYAGVIKAGWMPGAPALETRPWGHEAPSMVPHLHSATRTARPLESTVSQSDHQQAVARIREYLASGDIYQANLTVPLQGSTKAGPEDIFDVALMRGGAAFAATFITPEGTILSFSPELYLRRRGREIVTRPIKGTVKLPQEAGEINPAREALLASAKDRAEHVMIVDLERNDLGHLCEPGSIEVDPFLEVVEHPTVLHLESTVRGKLRDGVTVRDLFEASFPGGSITGAPKRRALEIIGELEKGPRGIYCGALGWIDCDGDCDLNLPIRTAMIRKDGTVEYHAGGGIVADSDAAHEWEEIRTKTAFFEGVLREAEEICRYDDADHH